MIMGVIDQQAEEHITVSDSDGNLISGIDSTTFTIYIYDPTGIEISASVSSSIVELGDGNSTGNYTYIFDETCPVAGYITKIEIFVGNESGGVLDFAVFNNTSGSTYEDQHRVTGLAISNGLNQYASPGDFAADALPIVIGEYIGAYLTSSGIWRKKTSGGPGYKYDFEDQIGTGGGTSFTTSPNTSNEMQIRVWIV